MAFTLDTIIPWGRSFAEYCRMFNLQHLGTNCKILGCGDGPSSFNAEGTQAGLRILSCDPMYRLSVEVIEMRIHEVYPQVVDQLEKNKEDYHWSEFTSPTDLGRHRLNTMNHFLVDYEEGLKAGRYLPAALPSLPFQTDAFELALCSHLFCSPIHNSLTWSSVWHRYVSFSE